jgi:hypothetical protein
LTFLAIRGFILAIGGLFWGGWEGRFEMKVQSSKMKDW